MKKSLFLLATAAVVLAGCNNDLTVSENPAADVNQPQEIKVSPFSSSARRSANAILTATFPTDNTMEVTCYKSSATAGNYFSKTTFSFVDDENDVWHASPAKYWPLSAATLNFFAVSGYGVDNDDIEIDDDLGTATVKYNADASNNNSSTAYTNATQSDIMYAFNRGAVTQSTNDLSFNGGTTVSASKVNMVFKHALSQIDFQVKAADAATASAITINSITLTGASYTGTLTLTNSAAVTATTGDVTTSVAWVANTVENRTVPNVPSAIIYSAGDATDYRPAAPSNACLLIIPNATSAYTSFTINYAFNGENYDYTYTPASTVAVAGNKYTFQINFRLHEITINPSVTEWVDNNTPIVVY